MGGGTGNGDTTDGGTSGLGRRLDVHVRPTNPYASWWLLPQGEGLRRAVTDGARPARRGPRSVLCDFGDRVPVGAWPAWPTHADREYHGEDVERVLLTVSQTTAAFFRPGRPVDVLLWTPEPALRPAPGGTLDGPAPNPERLVRALGRHARSRFFIPVGDARHPWQATVDRAAVTPDGRELWIEVSGDDDQVLARIDVEETPRRVGLRAWVAFGPDGPRGCGVRAGVRVLPDGRRVRTAFRRGTGRRWRTFVRLSRPLGAREVFDLASPDPNARAEARRAWQARPG